MKFLFYWHLASYRRKPYRLFGYKPRFRVAMGSPYGDHFRIRSFRKRGLYLKNPMNFLLIMPYVCLRESRIKKTRTSGMCAEKLILVLTHPPCAFTRRAPSLIISQSEIVKEGKFQGRRACAVLFMKDTKQVTNEKPAAKPQDFRMIRLIPCARWALRLWRKRSRLFGI